MRAKSIWIIMLLCLVFFLVPVVYAHTPLKPGEENHSLETAYEIPNPTKSWTIYREIHETGEAEYYKLRLEPGETLRISIYTPMAEDPVFAPNLVVMGPGIPSEGALPDFIEVPDGYGAALIEAERLEEPEYEPFTPTSYYYLSYFDMEIQDTGDYYFAVYEPANEGRYGVAVGYVEEFTLVEWLRIPLDVIGIHQWEGQSLVVILAPIIVTLAAGLAFLIWKSGMDVSAFKVVATTAGLLYVGSGLMTLAQMVIALSAAYSNTWFLTMIFILLPVLIGLAILWKAVKGKGLRSTKDRALFAVFGLVGLFTWAGVLIGPALSLLTSILPSEG